MTTKSKVILSVLLIVIIAICYYIFYGSYDWSEKYELEDNDPYNLSLIKNVFEKSGGNRDFYEIATSDSVIDFINPDSIRPNSNLISFGNQLFLDSLDIDKLLKFTSQGHQVYFFSNTFHRELLDTLLYEDESVDVDVDLWEEEELDFFSYRTKYLMSKYDTVCNYGFYESYSPNFPLVETKKRIEENVIEKRWFFFCPNVNSLEYNSLERLGLQNESELNFIRIKHGEGYFNFHSSPFAFTNLNYIREEFYNYSNEVFKDLGSGDIYWDQYLNNNHYNPANYTYSDDGSASNYLDDGPLTFILSERGLRWAWYFILISIVLYLFFGVRRKQTPIPVIAENKNTSLEYAETIGGLYYQKKDHRVLINLKMRQFKTYVQNSYGQRVKFETEKELQKIKDKIAVMSNIEVNKIDAIFNEYKTLQESSKVKSAQLVKFHDLLDDFYKNCK